MVDNDARFVYQLVSTDVSPDKNQISSERDASSWRDVERLLGSAISASAYWMQCVSVTLPILWIEMDKRHTSCHLCIIGSLLRSLAQVNALTLAPIPRGFSFSPGCKIANASRVQAVGSQGGSAQC